MPSQFASEHVMSDIPAGQRRITARFFPLPFNFTNISLLCTLLIFGEVDIACYKMPGLHYSLRFEKEEKADDEEKYEEGNGDISHNPVGTAIALAAERRMRMGFIENIEARWSLDDIW
jgi:hypothetical protein